MNTFKIRKLTVYLSLFLVFLFTAGCSASKKDKISEGGDVEFTNLASEESQKEIYELLKEAGVQDAYIDNFLYHVNQYNDVAANAGLAGSYIKADPAKAVYDINALSESWESKHPDFIGCNCRLTVYDLYKDFLTVDIKAPVKDDLLFLDFDASGSDSSFFTQPDDMQKFKALFSSVPTVKSMDSALHISAIEKSLKDRGIVFASSEKISLISVWLYEDIDEPLMFIGHTGVLLNSSKGLYFIEKLSFQEPYQAIRFNTENELKDYLMAKYDVDTSGKNAKPVLFKNGSLMKP